MLLFRLSMLRFYLCTIILNISLALLLCVPVSFAQTPMDCLHIISPPGTFNRVLDASEENSVEMLLPNDAYLDETLRQLNLSDANDRRIYLNALTLRPSIESGVMYESIAAEMILQGYKDDKKITTVMNNFVLLTAAEKAKLVDGILENMLFALGDQSGLASLEAIPKKAKRFRMSENELSALLKAFLSTAKSNHEEVRIIILGLLKKPGPTLVSEVLAFRSNFTSGLFRKAHALSPRIVPNSDGLFDDGKVSVFVNQASVKNVITFTRENLNALNLEQLQSVKDKYWSVLPGPTRVQIDAKVELIQLEEKLAEANAQLNEALKSSLNPKVIMDPNQVIELLSATKNCSTNEGIYQAVNTVLDANSNQLDSAGYLKVGLAILNISDRYIDPSWSVKFQALAFPSNAALMNQSDFYTLAMAALKKMEKSISHNLLHQGFSHIVYVIEQNKTLSESQEKALRNEVIRYVRECFRDDSWTNQTLRLVSKPLIKQPLLFSKAELESNITKLEARATVLKQKLVPVQETTQ